MELQRTFDESHRNRERIAEHGSWLRRKARAFLRGPLRRWLDSADLAQEALVQALRHVGGKRFPTLAAFRGWLAKVLRTVLAREGRRRMPEEAGSQLCGALAQPGPGVSSRVMSKESAERVRRALEQLPPRDQEVLQLRLWQELPFAQVARRLGIAEGHARVIFHRALEKLRRDGALDP